MKSRLVFEWVLFFVWKNSLGELPSYIIHPQEGDPFKNSHYAGPNHAVPTPIHCLPARISWNHTTLYPIKHANWKILGKERALLSANLTAIIMFIISKPPLSLGEFNKSAPFFRIVTLLFGPLKNPWTCFRAEQGVKGPSVVGKILVSPTPWSTLTQL